MTTGPVIAASTLKSILSDEDLVIIDARQGPKAKEEYLGSHISGAYWIDLESDLSAPEDPALGGRHPLPEIDHFTKVLEGLGIEPKSKVVIYDDKNGALAASRFWWMLKAVGHEWVKVLDGGLSQAIEAGIALSEGHEKQVGVSNYPAVRWLLPLVNMRSVEALLDDPDAVIIDVRANARYRGDHEPIDPVAGHIPGAVNIPFSGNLNSEGLFLEPDQLRSNYKAHLKDISLQKQIVHCGSGVTACHTILALEYAGMDLPQLYVGSWSEWCRNHQNEGAVK